MNDTLPELTTQVLGPDHDLSSFDSGEAELDLWLREKALTAQRRGSARTRVLTQRHDLRALGFYAITPHTAHRANLPGSAAGGLTVVPGYLIARLAVDRSLQGQGIGGALLLDALDTIVAAADAAGGRLVIVDALHDRALGFYERYGFVRIGETRRLYLKTLQIKYSLARAERT